MFQLIGILYFLFILTMFIAAIFVVFHFKRYTVDHTMAKFFIGLFSLVFILLLSWNIYLFSSISWQDFSPEIFTPTPNLNNSFGTF